jgi:membrane associated rhomboid family serine protease
MTAHDDAEVCYRHPDRHSWVLCDRCGRTICPECQISTPNGVYCPDCIRETSGAAPRWAPAGGAVVNNVTPIRRRRSPRWVKQLRELLVPDSGAPVITWTVVGALVVIFLVDLFARGSVFLALAAFPAQEPWQLWRYFTSALVTFPSSFSGLGLVINIVFFVLVAPTMERMLGRARFVTVLLASAGAGSAAMLLAGTAAYGLTGAMFGLFAAYFVVARQQGAPMTRFLVFMAVNVLITLVLNALFVIMIVGGVIGGGGAAALFFFHRDRGTRNQRTVYWQITGGVALLIGLAVLRTALT